MSAPHGRRALHPDSLVGQCRTCITGLPGFLALSCDEVVVPFLHSQENRLQIKALLIGSIAPFSPVAVQGVVPLVPLTQEWLGCHLA